MKEFTFEEQECFNNIEDENQFFSSQERQSIIHHLLDNLRAIKGEQLGKVKFVEGQSIGMLLKSSPYKVSINQSINQILLVIINSFK